MSEDRSLTHHPPDDFGDHGIPLHADFSHLRHDRYPGEIDDRVDRI